MFDESIKNASVMGHQQREKETICMQMINNILNFFTLTPLFLLNYRQKMTLRRFWYQSTTENKKKTKIWTRTSPFFPYRTQKSTGTDPDTLNKQTILLNNCNIIQKKRAEYTKQQERNKKKKPQLHHMQLLHQLLHFPVILTTLCFDALYSFIL